MFEKGKGFDRNGKRGKCCLMKAKKLKKRGQIIAKEKCIQGLGGTCSRQRGKGLRSETSNEGIEKIS